VIASLNGTVTRKDISSLVLETGGVGYLVSVLPQTSADISIGQQLSLQTAQIFREDSQSLYGFITTEELSVFQLLCSVSGVGPKSALAIVGQLGVSGVGDAVNTANDEMFRSVSGVGPKTAKLIVLTLSGKLVMGASAQSSVGEQVISALVNLGYLERTARETLKQVETDSQLTTEGELLKAALAFLSKSRKGA
jgi:Holliday junction DNA helicase RuvA